MFCSAVYRQRRQSLLQALGADGQTGLVLLMGQVDEAYNFAANPYTPSGKTPACCTTAA